MIDLRNIRTVLVDMDGVVADYRGGLDKWEGDGLPQDDLEWWAALEKLPWADELVATALAHNRFVVFCTSPGSYPMSATGKMFWLDRHYRSILNENHGIVITREKWLLARPDTLLIDDDPKNTGPFMRCGGLSYLLYPENVRELIDALLY